MARWLTVGIVGVSLWVALASRNHMLWPPATAIGLLALLDYRLWIRGGRRWHDNAAILLLLPAIVLAVWLGVGGLVLETDRSEDERLLFEVGPGITLTGLLCTLISYHGRHHPGKGPSP